MVSQYRRKHDTRDHDHLDARMSSVETAVSHIEAGMADIKESIRGGFSQLRTEMDAQSESSRPQFATWAGWATVILLVLGMFGSGYVRDLGRAEKEISETKKGYTGIIKEQAKHNEQIRALEREVFIKQVIIENEK